MFTFPRTARLPGFRVGLPEDLPGFDVNQDGSGSGSFADAPTSDSGPYGNPLQTALATDFGPAGIDPVGQVLAGSPWGRSPAPSTPQGVIPASCISAYGRLNCTTPLGRRIRPVPAPEGFAPRIDPDVPGYHEYNTPFGPVNIPEKRLMDNVIDYPTGGPRSLNRRATPEGTVNEATPEPYYSMYWLLSQGGRFRPGEPFGTPLGRVKSYLTEDQDGRRVVMNVTLPGHPLFPGYVVRYVTSSGDGSTIQTEGEGLAWPQDPGGVVPEAIRNYINVDTW